ncbi:hypothetical protein SLEP1_g35162 [Rubroshorea leprosula]|uniref:Retrotransposon Copia-like N-terminal domain-containing protein n=1 Tax=Rubroshorea leprosula TaxID=152421 RepID=A0AAV5KMD9_9ROSI|nr:hypothetical protein SLEP1_g35162 [Rubroshorea leprosula]
MSGGEDLPKKPTTPKDTFNSETNSSNSPFYLHHSDSLGTVLVMQPLTGDNYPAWNRAMTMALEAKNKLGFVDGTFNELASNSTMFIVWSRCNSMDERHRSIRYVSSLAYLEQSAMAVVNTQDFARSNQQFRTRNGRPFYHCDFCGLDGHIETRCRKKQGNQSFHTSHYKGEFKEP